jgi:hypothetical protein
MICAGDTKAGTLIAKDKYGNKYYENLEDELPCENFNCPSGMTYSMDTVRTRWVDYKDDEFDP